MSTDILLIEDDSANEEKVRRLLPAGLVLTCTGTLTRAIELLQQSSADLVLLDLGLSGSIGIDSELS